MFEALLAHHQEAHGCLKHFLSFQQILPTTVRSLMTGQ